MWLFDVDNIKEKYDWKIFWNDSNNNWWCSDWSCWMHWQEHERSDRVSASHSSWWSVFWEATEWWNPLKRIWVDEKDIKRLKELVWKFTYKVWTDSVITTNYFSYIGIKFLYTSLHNFFLWALQQEEWWNIADIESIWLDRNIWWVPFTISWAQMLKAIWDNEFDEILTVSKDYLNKFGAWAWRKYFVFADFFSWNMKEFYHNAKLWATDYTLNVFLFDYFNSWRKNLWLAFENIEIELTLDNAKIIWEKIWMDWKEIEEMIILSNKIWLITEIAWVITWIEKKFKYKWKAISIKDCKKNAEMWIDEAQCYEKFLVEEIIFPAIKEKYFKELEKKSWMDVYTKQFRNYLRRILIKYDDFNEVEKRLDWLIKKIYKIQRIVLEWDAVKKAFRYLLKYVRWQDKAIIKLLSQLSAWDKSRDAKLNEWAQNAPVPASMLLWPTWVWKTYTAKKLLEFLYWKWGANERLVTINCNELSDESKFTKIFGSPPSYVWFWWATVIDDLVKAWEWILLFDEFEKADPKLWQYVMQILDEWIITDNRWRKFNLNNFYVLFTSNAITEEYELITPAIDIMREEWWAKSTLYNNFLV